MTTITGYHYPGLSLGNGSYTIASTGTVHGSRLGPGGGGTGVYLEGGSLTNAGTISGGNGIYSVVNGAHAYRGGTGVYLDGGSLSNTGTINGGNGYSYPTKSGDVAGGGISGGFGANGVDVAKGGTLTNSSGGIIQGGAGGYAEGYGGLGGAGVYLLDGGTLANTGTITGGNGGNSYDTGAVGGSGVVLAHGGTLTNNSGGIIKGGNGSYGDGFFGGEADGGSGGAGVFVPDGGTLTNAGSISGGYGGTGAGNGGNGASLGDGCTLTNDSGGVISGGVAGHDGASGVNVGGTGASLGDGSTLSNHSGGVISGGYGGAGPSGNANGGIGVVLVSGASLSNAGSISGGAGHNGGRYASPTGGAGVDLNGGGTLSNTGAITGGAGGTSTSYGGGTGGFGVYLTGSGSVTNDSGGVISAGAGGSGTGSHGGRGGNGGAGVERVSGGLTNAGTITGGTGGSPGDASVTFNYPFNSGGNGGDGVDLVGDSTLTNDSGGVISAGAGSAAGPGGKGRDGNGGAGVDLANGGTLTNAGTISGGANAGGGIADAVYFNGTGDSRLIADPGAVFNGNVVAEGSGNVLELASVSGVGTISGIGTQFTGFQTVQVDSGATWDVTGPLVNNGTIIDDGTLDIAGPITGTGVIELDPSTLILGAVAAGQAVDLNGTNNVVDLTDPTQFLGTIGGFAASDTIEVPGVISGDSFNATSGVLTVTASGGTYDLQFANPGGYAGQYFNFSGGNITLSDMPCYCPGTLILTPCGEVAVEDLAIGDWVITHTGAPEPVKWIGRRSYAGRFLAGQTHILPVRIQAGALAEGLPKRDLFVSPRHAMYLEGYLVPAGELVNGLSITQEPVERVDYIHIELASHALIWAEGAAAETFVDDNSRMLFANADEYALLYPDEERQPAQFCAERVSGCYETEMIRWRLADRAAEMWPVNAKAA